jgi:hypothetical protein
MRIIIVEDEGKSVLSFTNLIFQLLFKETDSTLLGDGPAVFEWRPGGNHIAIGG